MVKNCFLFCIVCFFCSVASVETEVFADVVIDGNALSDPTTFGVGDTLPASSDLFVDGTSVFNLSGGSLDGFADFSGSSTLNVTSGSAGTVFLQGNATANISGGAIAFLDSSSGTTVNISGGDVGFGVAGGSVTISGGSVDTPDFSVASGDSLEISGGNVSVGTLNVSTGGTATISAGVDLDNLFFIGVDGAGASLNLVGANFRLVTEDTENFTITETPFTGTITDSFAFFNGFLATSLAGTLLDGTEFQISEASRPCRTIPYFAS